MNYKERSKPIYLQIADRITDDIMSGRYEPGQRIPSVREAASTYQVNANTMMRVYEYLASREIIQNQRGIGFFITDTAHENIKHMREETFFNDEMTYFFDRLISMDIIAERLALLYTNYKNQKS